MPDATPLTNRAAATALAEHAAQHGMVDRLRYAAWCLVQHGASFQIWLDDQAVELLPLERQGFGSAAPSLIVTAFSTPRRLTVPTSVPLLWTWERQVLFNIDCVERELHRFSAWTESDLIEPQPVVLLRDARAHVRGMLSAKQLSAHWSVWESSEANYLYRKDPAAAAIWTAAWGCVTSNDSKGGYPHMSRDILRSVHNAVRADTDPDALPQAIVWQQNRLLAYLLDQIVLSTGEIQTASW